MVGLLGKVSIAVATMAAISYGAIAKPFPTSESFAGCAKPTVGSPANDIKSEFDDYRSSYLKKASDGSFYILQNQDNGKSGTSVTTSEAHGYGMISMVLMAGYYDSAQTVFDGMVKFYKNHPSSGDNKCNPYGMNWAPTSATSNDINDAATDGDMDIAYALILADKQWGSTGTYNYMVIAKQLLGGMLNSYEFNHSTTGRIGLSDDAYDDDMTRSSDWMIGHLLTFKSVDAANASKYDKVITATKACIASTANASTGLLPGFAKGTPASPYQYTYEPGSQNYDNNACRDPWRLAMAYMHFGDAACGAAATKIANWGNTQSFQIKDGGYTLSGSALQSGWSPAAQFVAPMAPAAAVTGNQTMVNSAWTAAKNASITDVYGHGVKLMSMLAASGNWWNPVSVVVTNPILAVTQSTGGTITYSPNKTTFTNGETVTLTATTSAGYVFRNWTGSASGTTNPITITMDASKSIGALFEKTGTGDSTDLVTYAGSSWFAYADAGATGDTGTIEGENPISVNYTVPYDTVKYPSYGLGCYVPTGLTGLTSVTLSYTSSDPLLVEFETQAGKDPYVYELPKATTKSTVTISLSQFADAGWGTPGTLTIAKDSSILFAPQWPADGQKATGTVTVYSLFFNGVNLPEIVVDTNHYALTVVANNGSVTKTPDATTYLAGTAVKLKATPSNGYIFSGWTGHTTGSKDTITVYVDSAMTVTANFVPSSTTYTLATSGTNGTLTISPVKSAYNAGESVTITANASTGYKFSGWSGDATGSTNPLTVTMNGDKTITASFVVTSTEAPNLVSLISWEEGADALGSSAVIDSSKKANGTISAVVKTVQNTDYESYSSLAGYLDTTLEGSTAIHLTYTASKDFWLSLDNGADGFGVLLAAGTKTVTLALNSATFVKPSWSTSTATLDISKISGIAFDPVTDNDDVASTVVNGTIIITNLSIDGFIGNDATPITNLSRATNKNALSMGMVNGELRYSIPTSGMYKLSLYSMNGRMIGRIAEGALVSGVHTVAMSSYASGAYVVRVEGIVSGAFRVMLSNH